MKRFLQVVDGFYSDPDRIRRRALGMKCSEPDTLVGLRTQAYQPRGIRKLIERTFRLRINYWEDDVTAIEASNGVFFSSLGSGSNAESICVHFDRPPSWISLILYLTPNAPYDAGTSLWQHRETGLIAKPTKTQAAQLGISMKEFDDLMERDGTRRKCWREIDRVGNVYNRAVIFPAGFFHSATRHFGSNRKTGRMYQSFHFPIVPLKH